MENLNIRVENIKKSLLKLINLLDSNSVDSHSLRKTYKIFEITTDEEQLEELVNSVSKLLSNSILELENTWKKIKKIKNNNSEKIENYNDSIESEELINNIK